jgi:ectoine hydroxylase-related dioxygenase (phytanoyl-CoA dioxygenase family)
MKLRPVDCAALQADFDGKGYAVIPAFIPAQQIGGLAAIIEAIQFGVAGLSERDKARLIMERDLPAHKRDGIAADQTGDAIFMIGDPPAFDARFASVLVEPELVSLVRQLLGTTDIQYHFSNVVIKSARVGSGISWHRDYPNAYMCPQRSSFRRVMICLDGMDGNNGGTQFVRQSHLISDADAHAAKTSRTAPLPAEIETASSPPGSVVVIHPKSLHGGPPNASRAPRRNLVVQWGRADDPIGPVIADPDQLTGFTVGQINDWLAAQVATKS